MQTNRQNELIRALIEKRLKEDEQNYQLQNHNFNINKINDLSSKTQNFGEGLSNAGDYLSNNFSSMDKIGNGLQSVGNALQTGANAVQKVIPTSTGAINAIGTKIGSAIGGGATGAAGGSVASGAAAAGPIGALAALGMMAVQGTNRNRAKQTNEQSVQSAQEQINIAKDRLAQTQQNSELLANQNEIIPNNSVQNFENDYLNKYSGDTQNLIDSYIQSAFQKNNNPENTVNLSDEQMKQDVFNKLADGLGDFLTGYKENRENAFTPDNLRPVDNKGFMQRMGEGAGTIARIAQKPLVQGLAAGGLSTVLTGNPLYGLGMANKFANNKMNSDLYQQILKNQGVNFDDYNGVITSDDMSKILSANKYQRGFLTRKDYDRLRLENGLISVEEYNQGMSAPGYNPDEMVNLSGLEAVSKAGRYAQQNKNDKNTNYYRSKNQGKNVIKVEYGEKPDSHNYTHVTYGAKPEQKSTTHVTYGEKPQNNQKEQRVKVKSPDGKIGSIPASQLAEAIKKGYKKL